MTMGFPFRFPKSLVLSGVRLKGVRTPIYIKRLLLKAVTVCVSTHCESLSCLHACLPQSTSSRYQSYFSLSLLFIILQGVCGTPFDSLSLSLSLRLFGGGPHLCTDCVDEVPQVSGGLLQAVW